MGSSYQQTLTGEGLYQGTVESVGLSLPNIFTVSNSPVTDSGTLTGTLATQTANKVFASPTSGGAATPTFRALVQDDLNTIMQSNSYTPTFSGMGTVSNVVAYYTRLGNLIYVWATWTCGTVAASEARISLPNSWTISNSATVLCLFGDAGNYAGGTARSIIGLGGNDYVNVGLYATNGGLSATLGSDAFSTGAVASARFLVPIQGLT